MTLSLYGVMEVLYEDKAMEFHQTVCYLMKIPLLTKHH